MKQLKEYLIEQKAINKEKFQELYVKGDVGSLIFVGKMALATEALKWIEEKPESDIIWGLKRHIEVLERRQEIYKFKLAGREGVFCGCIDKCSSKRKEWYCISKRGCVDKL